MVGKLPAGNNPVLPDIKIIIPLKNLSNFIFNLNFLMINTETELILKWSQNFVLTEKQQDHLWLHRVDKMLLMK